MNSQTAAHASRKSLTPAQVAGQENFTIHEFSVWCRLSRASVYRAIKSGALRVTKIGGRTIIRRHDGEAFIGR